MAGKFLAGDFLAHAVIFGDFMDGNFLAGDFLGGYRLRDIRTQRCLTQAVVKTLSNGYMCTLVLFLKFCLASLSQTLPECILRQFYKKRDRMTKLVKNILWWPKDRSFGGNILWFNLAIKHTSMIKISHVSFYCVCLILCIIWEKMYLLSMHPKAIAGYTPDILSNIIQFHVFQNNHFWSHG